MEQPPVQIGQYVLGKNLGIGAFGKVRRSRFALLRLQNFPKRGPCREQSIANSRNMVFILRWLEANGVTFGHSCVTGSAFTMPLTGCGRGLTITDDDFEMPSWLSTG